MNLVKSLGAAFIAVFLSVTFVISVTGCSTIERLGEYIQENPVFSSIAVRQAVGTYIMAGDTVQEEQERARKVQEVNARAMLFLDGNPQTTVDQFLMVVDSSIQWAKLSPTDRMLIKDIMSLVEEELRKYESQTPGLSKGAKFALKTVFEAAVSAAELYVMR